MTTTMTIEVLYFEGCPNHETARKLIERVAPELGVKSELRLVEIPDQEAAVRMRFLGSPTIRVDDRDVEPGADERDEFVLACRIYRTPDGLRGEPAEAWLRDALLAAR